MKYAIQPHGIDASLTPVQYQEIVNTLNKHYNTTAFYSLGDCMGLEYKNGKLLAIPPAYLADPEFKALLDKQNKLKLF